jgi:hypothetical protein
MLSTPVARAPRLLLSAPTPTSKATTAVNSRVFRTQSLLRLVTRSTPSRTSRVSHLPEDYIRALTDWLTRCHRLHLRTTSYCLVRWCRHPRSRCLPWLYYSQRPRLRVQPLVLRHQQVQGLCCLRKHCKGRRVLPRSPVEELRARRLSEHCSLQRHQLCGLGSVAEQ